MGEAPLTRTRVIRIGAPAEGPFPVGEIAAALLEGAVAAYPTETFYALGAAAFSRRGVERVHRLKKREEGKPLPLIVSDLDMVGELCGPFPAAYRVLAGEFWPGPLTLVLPASSRLPDFLLGPGRTVAVRIPPLPWLRALVREISQPLTATSANLSGEEAVAEADQVIAIFGGKVEIVVDGGRTPGGGPSTVVDLSSPEPRVLREGAVSAARIRAALLP